MGGNIMYRHEVRGYFLENKKLTSFVIITPPLMNAYQAELYVIGRMKEYVGLIIDKDSITRIID